MAKKLRLRFPRLPRLTKRQRNTSLVVVLLVVIGVLVWHFTKPSGNGLAPAPAPAPGPVAPAEPTCDYAKLLGTLLETEGGIYFRELFSPGPEWPNLTGNVYDIQVAGQNTRMTLLRRNQGVVERDTGNKLYQYTVELNPSLENPPNEWVDVTGCLVPQ